MSTRAKDEEAYEALGNAIGAALEAGWTLADFQRDAADLWPTIVSTYAQHIAETALADAAEASACEAVR